METAEKEVVEVEERSESNSVDYQFYQQMRGYIRDLLSCLTEKVLIEVRVGTEEVCVHVHLVLKTRLTYMYM